MFVVHGQSGTINAIVGASSLAKAVMHLNRMTQAGLNAFITDERGQLCTPQNVLSGFSDRRSSTQ